MLATELTRLAGVRHPVVQTGMGWVSGPRLVSATANAGGLGIIASATMTLAELDAAIVTTKRRTGSPFGVNLRSDAADANDRVDLLIRHGVKVASFALAPKKDLIAKLKDHGVVVMPSVVDAVDIPVVAAGGFYDGRGLAAALAYGAAGIAMGTRFLLTSDSPVPDEVKRLYLERGLDGTVVTTKVDG